MSAIFLWYTVFFISNWESFYHNTIIDESTENWYGVSSLPTPSTILTQSSIEFNLIF